MQIKTIKNRLDNAEEFDTDVNKALSEGYLLTRRTIIIPNQPANNSTSFLHNMLYAELVKYDESELNIEKGGIKEE